MRHRRRRREAASVTKRVLEGAALLSAAYVAIRSIPELVRYIKISRM
jgi:hypothetical protein